MADSEKIELTIDGQTVTAEPGMTVLEASRQAGVGDIPVVCYSEHTKANGLCRLCLIETEGWRGMQAACVTAAQPGMAVHTRSDNVIRARRTLLEMLASAVELDEAPELQQLLANYNAHPERFAGGRTVAQPLLDDNPAYLRDYSKCILCWRCVQVCAADAQYTYAINFDGRGFGTSVATFFDNPMPETTCVFCGQCVGTCPTGALKSKREYLLEKEFNGNI